MCRDDCCSPCGCYEYELASYLRIVLSVFLGVRGFGLGASGFGWGWCDAVTDGKAASAKEFGGVFVVEGVLGVGESGVLEYEYIDVAGELVVDKCAEFF